MKIDEFLKSFNNHPVLFVGTGISLRYLKDTFTWDGLLSYISNELKGNDEFYYDLKYKYQINGEYDYPKIARGLESEFHAVLQDDRNGKFKNINDIFYKNIAKNINISRFKIFITELLKSGMSTLNQTIFLRDKFRYVTGLK